MTRARSAAAGMAITALMLGGCAYQPMSGWMHDRGQSQSDYIANHADRAFVMMMIPHHQQAIEMSDSILSVPGVDAEISALAKRITSAQRAEIRLMRSWLKDWGVGYTHGQMMSAPDLAAPSDAPAATAGRVFLERMIEHHLGAIDMAEREIARGQDPKVIDLAQRIVTDQTAEIDEMRTLLASR